MNDNFYYTFPALKGIQSRKDYYVIMCPLKILSKLFIFNEDDMSVEYRAQRIINKARIPEIADYILANPNDYVFSSITASVDGKFQFEPYANSYSEFIGTLKISMDSKLLINDGQHRRAAIEEALKADPELGNETISVVLFIDENLKKSQQIFSDLNKHAVNVSKSIGIMYDSRDPLAIITKQLIESNINLKNYTDKENTSLPKFSNKLFILSSIYETNKRIFNKINLDDEKAQKFIFEFWEFLCCTLKEWQFVFKKDINAHNFRDSYLSATGVVLESLGNIGNYLYKNHYNDWQKILINLNEIDWNRNNLVDWQNRVISQNGKIIKSSNHIKLTTTLIKIKLNIPLTKEEEKLENNFRKELK